MTFKISILLALALLFTACASKETKQSESAAAVANSDAANPMNFDAQGSDSGKIEGLFTIHFEYDKAKLDEKNKGILEANIDWMKKNPKAKLQIEGHCDQRGSIEYNLALGERRAKEVMGYMVTLGIAKERLSTVSYGKEKPLINSDSEMAQAQNRRANFVPLKN